MLLLYTMYILKANIHGVAIRCNNYYWLTLHILVFFFMAAALYINISSAYYNRNTYTHTHGIPFYINCVHYKSYVKTKVTLPHKSHKYWLDKTTQRMSLGNVAIRKKKTFYIQRCLYLIVSWYIKSKTYLMFFIYVVGLQQHNKKHSIVQPTV